MLAMGENEERVVLGGNGTSFDPRSVGLLLLRESSKAVEHVGRRSECFIRLRASDVSLTRSKDPLPPTHTHTHLPQLTKQIVSVYV